MKVKLTNQPLCASPQGYSSAGRKQTNKTNGKLRAGAAVSALALLAGPVIGTLGAVSKASAAQSITFSVQAASTLALTITDNGTTVGNNGTVEMDITPTNDGVFSSRDLAISVSSNNETGYTLAMSTPNTNLTRATALTNGSYPVIPTLAYSASGYSEESFPSNAWGYKIDSGTNYLSVPSTVNLKHTTNASGSNDTTLTLGTKIDNSIPSGTYTTTLNFYAVANYVPPVAVGCTSNQICYNPNGADGVTAMANQSASNGATLFASNFSYSGHGFRGWNTKADGSGTYYGPHQTVTADQLNAAVLEQQPTPEAGQDNPTMATNGLMLYAIWMTPTGTLQSFDAAACSALTAVTVTGTGASAVLNPSANSVVALTDARDGNVYTVARLADGKCWMTENLRLSNGAEIATTDTNNPSLPLLDSASQTTSNRLSASSSEWCTSQSAACYDNSKLNTSNTDGSTAEMTGNGQAVYSYGNYYNWYSATAGNGKYSTSANNTQVAGDLCPTGWHLPIGGSTPIVDGSVTGGNSAVSEFYALMKASLGGTEPNQTNQYSQAYYDSSTNATGILRTYPNNFLYSGNWNGGQAGDRGSVGYYWSSTAYSAAYAYRLSFNSSDVDPGTYYYVKYRGFAVRCVAGS